ncbi:hypothetical protein [Levyella massiliensis]|uniref:hypothetical protein n=1 Tax=Levyella massiliensis TaxID=938289 RepID=UPI003EC0B6B2
MFGKKKQQENATTVTTENTTPASAPKKKMPTWQKLLAGFIVIAVLGTFFGGGDKTKDKTASQSSAQTESSVSSAPAKSAESAAPAKSAKSTAPAKGTPADLIKTNAPIIKADAVEAIEKIESVRIEDGMFKNMDWKVVQYNSKPITDKNGDTYPITAFVGGQFETKKTGQLCDFYIGLGFKNKEELEGTAWHCLEYVNASTGYYVATINKEDSVIQKIVDAAKGANKSE